MMFNLFISDGNWGEWTASGTCSVTCSGGTQPRTRLCNNPTPANGGATCAGSSTDSISCNAQLCVISEITSLFIYIIFLINRFFL
jgi:hypothetical protein